MTKRVNIIGSHFHEGMKLYVPIHGLQNRICQ